MKGAKNKAMRQMRTIHWPDGSVEIAAEESRFFFGGRYWVRVQRLDDDDVFEVPLSWLKAKNRSKQ